MILYAACVKKKVLHISSKISGSSCYRKTLLFAITIFSFTISIAQPTITSFSPSYGPVGSLVTISGTNLSNPTSFTIGGVAAIIVSNSGTSLVAMVMPGATTGGISISNAGGTANSSGNFTVIATLSPQLQQGNKLVATLSGSTPKLGHSVAISADGNTAIVGAKDDFSTGAAVVYTRNGNVWSQQGAKLVGTGGINSGQQGWSVAISADGNTAIVGGISDDSNNGAAWIFTRTGTTWTQQGNKLVGTGNTGAANQGYSVALSADGNTALVGGYVDNGSVGAVWVFTRTGTTWKQQGNKLVGSGNNGSRQGSSVSISADGNTAIVGGRQDDGNIGAAWIFTRSGTSWSQQGNALKASDNVGDAYFGTSVSISADGNTAVIGGYIDDSNQGAAWVFTRSGTTWSQQESKLVGTGGAGTPQRGSSVGISADGNTIIIGAQSDNGNRGATWVFKRSGTTWSQQGSKLVGTGASGSARQGVSGALSADGNTAIIGGNEDNSDAGAAWVFIALNAPTITSFTPSNAKPGDVVTITGTNFNTTTTKNNVFFGATKATVSAATTTSLTVTVPTGATFDYITVLNTDNSLVGASKTKFTPVFSPSKTSITASSFQPKIDFASGTNPYAVAVGDLDGDGKSDMVVADYGSNTISVYRNTSTSGSIGSGSFATKVDFTTGTNPTSVAIGDLDGDGKPDLVVGNGSSSNVSVFRNTSTSGSIGSGSFAAKVDFGVNAGPRSVAIGDVDGDGKADLAIANGNAGNVSVLKNTSSKGTISTASFADKVDFTVGTTPYFVTIGDIDGDGKPELVTANYNNNAVYVLRNTSTAGTISSSSFASAVSFSSGDAVYGVAIGDLDGDGKADVVAANGEDDDISVFRNTSTSGTIDAGSFATKVNFNTGNSPRSVAIGDFDGDGKPDLAVANIGSNTVSVFRNTSTSGSIGSSSFTTKVDFSVGSNPGYVSIADIDGDGKSDLLLANRNSDNISILRNSDLPPTITSFTPSSAKPGDVVTITGTNFNATTTNNIVFFGATRATVTAASTTSLTVTLPTGATYDYISVLNTVTTLSGASKTKFTPVYSPNKTNITTTDFQPKVDYANGNSPYAIAIGDLDGDGKPDLAVANNGNSTVSVYRNTSSSGAISASSFATKVDFSTGTDTSPSGVAIGDLDGDGKPDLIVVNGGVNSISVFRNTSSSGSISASSFATKVDFVTGIAPWAAAIGDLDGDGKPEIAVTNFQSASVSVFRNTSTSGSIGTGSFAAKVDFTTGTRPLTLAVGDLDGDGKPDLVIPNQLSASVSVLRNTSTSGTIESGSFAAKVDFTTGTNPYAVAIGDLDADGKADMAVANHNSNSISLFRNTSTSGTIGSGSFAAKVDFTTGTNPFSLAISDLDGDGKADLAVANYGSNSISVFRNTSTSGTIGSGSFAAKVDFTTGNSPSVVAIGDLDGDGKPDLAVTNYIGGNISVLRNTGIPTITTSGTLTAINTTYGSASANTSFSVSATALTNNLLITAPTGYQVSTSISTGFASSITLIPSSGAVASTTVYIRIPGTTAVGTYSGNIVCTSSGATTRNVATVSSTVTAAALTITASNINKIYGAILTGAVGNTAFTSTGLQNSETIGSVTVTYGTGGAATAAVGTYTGSVTPSAATGGTFTASNYSITYATGNIIVNAAPLTITATNQSKTYGSAPSLGTTMVSLTGILNTDAVTGVTLTSTGTAATANVGTYNIIPSAATGTGLGNYNITYTNGTLTVNPATLTITATNQTKCFGFNLTLPTNGYTVSGILNSDVVNGVSLTSTGTVSTAAINTYPIIPSAAIGSGLSNYTINYINGVLTVAASISIVTQPVTAITQCAGTTATISVVATGAPSFTYQWFLNNNPISNATASSYSVSSLTTANAGSYTVAITPNNGCATVTSNASIWTVNSQPIPGPITIPSLVCTGLSYTLSNSVPGGVWSSSNMGVATIGTTSGVITPLSQGNTTINYAITNSFGCIGTTTAVLPVLRTPTKPVITRDFNGNLNSSYAGINIWYNASTQQTVNGVSTSSYNPRANVRIQVQGNNGGCIGPISDEFIYTTSSIATIYPNPAGSFTVASIVSDRAQNIILQLTDMAGKLLQEIPVILSTGQNPVRINTTTLAKGTYMLVIKGNGLTYIQFAKE